MKGLPNLAARPFVNRRPLVRVALAGWVVGGLLALYDAGAYWRYATGEGRREEQAVELEAQRAEEQVRIDAAVDVLAAIDLEWQAEQVRFVNFKAAEQTFSWSRLFDQVGEALPDGVRLTRLSPRGGRGDYRRLTSQGLIDALPQRVGLEMNGAARDSDALYGFVDALFAHPAFERPDLQRESHREEVEFTLSAIYLPDGAAMPGEGSAPPGSRSGGDGPVGGEAVVPGGEAREAFDVALPEAEVAAVEEEGR